MPGKIRELAGRIADEDEQGASRAPPPSGQERREGCCGSGSESEVGEVVSRGALGDHEARPGGAEGEAEVAAYVAYTAFLNATSSCGIRPSCLASSNMANSLWFRSLPFAP